MRASGRQTEGATLMFALRGVAVSLTFFVLVYCLVSALVLVSWRGLRRLKASERELADLLFFWRVLPLLAAITVTVAFVIPSFELLEPRSADEGVGTMPIGLGLAAVFLIAWGCWRAISAQIDTSRAVARWLADSEPLGKAAPPVAFRSRRDAPPLMLAGMRRPRVLVSEAAVEVLTAEELQRALYHELAHIRSRDNLKKLLFRCCPFLGMAPLETAWSQAAELTADDDAVHDANDALNLAAALVKLSRLITVTPACTTGFVSGSLNERVNRLLRWEELRDVRRGHVMRWAIVPGLLTVAFGAFMTYGSFLAMTHELTEWLVR
jgi:Zn-dependent protease with chaperone function